MGNARRLIVLAALATLLAAGGEAAPRRGHRLAQPRLHPVPRIVNGTLTAAYPSTAALLAGGTTDSAAIFCSATLIGCQTVLTAAHCVCDYEAADCGGAPSPAGLWVFLQHAGIFPVASVAVHPAYFYPDADVAVLTLAAPVDGIAPSAINLLAPATGVAGTIVGFGRQGGVLNDYGLKRVGPVTTAACTAGLSDVSSLCWNFTGTGANTCNGDSGGPLFADFGGGAALSGVTSGGVSSTCLPTDHSYDANVYTYSAWIAAQAGSDLGGTSCGTLPSAGGPGTIDHGRLGNARRRGHVPGATPSPSPAARACFAWR